MARGDTSRVWDYYTRDRSTPQRDLYWGGQSDLTASMAWEEDGETTIFFRKKLVVCNFSTCNKFIMRLRTTKTTVSIKFVVFASHFLSVILRSVG